MHSLNSDAPIIYTDADGVIFNWLDGFIEYCASVGHQAISNEPSYFNMTDIFPSLDKPWTLIDAYQASDFYHNIKAYEDARALLKKAKGLGAKIVIVTSCGDTEDIITSRNKSVDREFERCVDDIIYLPLASSKKDTLIKLPSGIFIDDQSKMAIEGAEAGHLSILRDRSYNINDHNDAYSRITNMNQLLLAF